VLSADAGFRDQPPPRIRSPFGLQLAVPLISGGAWHLAPGMLRTLRVCSRERGRSHRAGIVNTRIPDGAQGNATDEQKRCPILVFESAGMNRPWWITAADTAATTYPDRHVLESTDLPPIRNEEGDRLFRVLNVQKPGPVQSARPLVGRVTAERRNSALPQLRCQVISRGSTRDLSAV
jgi:hypothetical protein